ncbi:glycosyltransferase family 2 protein [Actinomadura keratinilytica]
MPLPEFLERMLGYFRDPDVAFVVGPQVYGNYTAPVTKAAESQQFLFHALIQRAGNGYRAPMFVGTNNVVRISAVKQIGGLYDSITEDMATGFELHRTRNPSPAATGVPSTPRTCSPSARAPPPGRTSSPSSSAGREERTRRSSSST